MQTRLKLAASVVACTLFLALCIHTTQRHVELLQNGRLDRTIAELKASEHAALDAMRRTKASSAQGTLERLGVNTGGWGEQQKHARKAPTQGLHRAWIMRESEPRLERDAHVNTGVQFERRVIGDNGVEIGEPNPSMPYGAKRELVVHQREPATARPPSHLGKLDKLGVNTGILHNTWDDGMSGTRGMEDSYSFGSTPVREDNSPLATVGLLASVPSRLFPGRVFGHGDAHSYFKDAVMPFMGDAKRPVHHADNKLFQQARQEKQEAIAAEKRFARQIAEARAAEQRAHEVKVLAEGVTTAKQAVLDAKAKEKAAEHMYENELAANQKRLQALGAIPKGQLTTTKISQTDLDKAVAGDRRENKALSSDKDVGDVLGAINGLPKSTTRQNKSARKSQLSSQAATSTSWACSFSLFGMTPFC